MIFPGHLATFAALVFVMVVIPGPSVLFTISRSLTVGRRQALVTVLGNSTGVYAQVVAVAFGLGTLLQQSMTVFTMVKLVGAGYLVYLGIQAIRHRRKLSQAFGATVKYEPIPTLAALRDGFVVGFTNPKSIVFLAAVLPQFVDYSAGPVPIQVMILGIALPVVAVITDSMWALIAGTARSWFASSPRRLELIGGTGGLVMIGLGASLAASGRKD